MITSNIIYYKLPDKLRILHKEVIRFKKSTHLPNFEEPDAFHDFCLSKLKPLVN